MANAKQNERLKLAAEIGAELPGTWTLRDEYAQPVLAQRDATDQPTGREIVLSTPYNKTDRFEISACGWPKDADDKACYPRRYGTPDVQPSTISAAKSRGAKAIAADIVRKLLPEYYSAFAEQADRAAATFDHDATARATAHRLCDAMGISRTRAVRRSAGDYEIRTHKDAGPFETGSITVSGSYVRVYSYVDPDALCAMLSTPTNKETD